VLYGTRRTYLRKVGVADFKGVSANTTLALGVLGNQMLADYLPWLMSGPRFVEFSIRESKGSVNPFINWSDIARFEFDLPSLDEQRRVVEVMRAVDWEIEAAEALVRASRVARSAVAVEIDSGVDKVRLDEVCEVVMGHSPSGSTYNQDAVGTPLLQGSGEFGETSPSARLWTTDQKARLVPAGSVLISVRAPVGGTNLSDCEYAIGRGLAALIPASGSFSAGDIMAIVEGASWRLNKFSTGSTVKAVTAEVLRSLQVPLQVDSDLLSRYGQQVLLQKSAASVTSSLRSLRTSLLQELIG
jgi:type I restriction enzyme S subunit